LHEFFGSLCKAPAPSEKAERRSAFIARRPATLLETDINQSASGRNRIFQESRLSAFERHVFVCHNSRPAGAPRPSCTSDGSSDLHTRLQQLTKAAGLAGKVRINKSGCLDQCEHGPVIVVYPEAVWYCNVRAADAEEIVAEHLVAGRPVERLRFAEDCLNSRTCSHCGD